MRNLNLFLILLALCLIGCSKTIRTLSSSAQEESFCTQSCVTNGTCTGTTVAVSGTALYERRLLTPLAGLGGRDTTGSGTSGNFPIRGAEVQILKNNSIFHCTTTNDSGVYNFNLPSDGSTYTIKVNSRAFDANNKASVLDTPDTKNYYSLTTTVVATGPGPLTANVPNATFNGDIKGGAFNILDKVYETNKVLKDLTSTGPTPFQVDHKATIYWAKGVNPATYVGGNASDGLSFYAVGRDEMYILGGIEGDTDNEDTDHFDDSVIIHEYGHFIEDNYSRSDSPGGFHDGKRIIDPRLAWSEAFATFLMAIVTKNPVYRDSIGNASGTSYYGIYYNIETNQSLDDPTGPTYTKLDTSVANSLGEGNFREFAITRVLHDMFDNIPSGLADSDADGIDEDFENFWHVFVGAFKTTEAFPDAGLFFKLLTDYTSTSYSTLHTNNDNETQSTRLEYGWSNTITNPTGPQLSNECLWTLKAEDQVGNTSEGRATVIDDGNDGASTNGIPSAYRVSNQLKSNDFFYINHPGGTLNVQLQYTSSGAQPGTADLDLHIYREGYIYGGSSGRLASSVDFAPDDLGTEEVSITAPAGHYLINVMYWTGGAGSRIVASTNYFKPAEYTIRVNSNRYFCR